MKLMMKEMMKAVKLKIQIFNYLNINKVEILLIGHIFAKIDLNSYNIKNICLKWLIINNKNI